MRINWRVQVVGNQVGQHTAYKDFSLAKRLGISIQTVKYLTCHEKKWWLQTLLGSATGWNTSSGFESSAWTLFLSKRVGHHSNTCDVHITWKHDQGHQRCFYHQHFCDSMKLLLSFFYCRQMGLGNKNLQSIKQKLATKKDELKVGVSDLASSLKSTSIISYRTSRTFTPLYLQIFFPSRSEKHLPDLFHNLKPSGSGWSTSWHYPNLTYSVKSLQLIRSMRVSQTWKHIQKHHRTSICHYFCNSDLLFSRHGSWQRLLQVIQIWIWGRTTDVASSDSGSSYTCIRILSTLFILYCTLMLLAVGKASTEPQK